MCCVRSLVLPPSIWLTSSERSSQKSEQLGEYSFSARKGHYVYGRVDRDRNYINYFYLDRDSTYMRDYRNLAGKVVEIDYLGTGTTVLGRVTQTRLTRHGRAAAGMDFIHHFDFLTPFRWESDGAVITRDVGEGSCADDETVIKVWGDVEFMGVQAVTA